MSTLNNLIKVKVELSLILIKRRAKYEFWRENDAPSIVVVVVLVVGPISTAAIKACCTLTHNGVPSFISRGAVHQAA
jgi:hypothetical protein